MRKIPGALALGLLLATGTVTGDSRGGSFVGWITDTECGPNHAPMIAKGGMGSDDAECTRKCVAKGATYGFVDLEKKRFYQLDEQDAAAALAGRKVRVDGRMEGDTIYVERIEAAD